MFAFTLKNKAGETQSWHIDLKNKGEVGTGLGDKPTGKAPSLYGNCGNGCGWMRLDALGCKLDCTALRPA